MDRKGAALIFVFLILIGLIGVALAFLTMTADEIKASGAGLWNTQAFYIAEAGRAKARWALTEGGEDDSWSETDEPFGEGTYTVDITVDIVDTYTITSEGYVPNDTDPLAKRKVVEENIPTVIEFANLSLTASDISASSVYRDDIAYRAYNAIDGNSETRWKSDLKNGSWLKLDFGSPTTFNQVVIDGNKITPSSCTIEYSADDVVYQAVTNLVELPLWTFTFDSVTAQYLMFHVNGNKPEVNELETYNTAEPILSLGQGEFVTSW